MMRQFSKVSTTIWDSKKFKKLPSDDARLAYLYLLTCPQGNSAGCFNLSVGFATDKLDWERARFLKAMESLSIAGLIDFDEDEKTVLLTNWFAFNCPTNPKHATGTLNELRQVASLRLQCEAVHALKDAMAAKKFFNDRAFQKAIESLCQDYAKAISTETETETEIQTETETETETETLRTVDARARGALPSGAAPDARSEVDSAREAFEQNQTPENWEALRSAVERSGQAIGPPPPFTANEPKRKRA